MSFSLNIQFVCKKIKLDDKAYHLSFAGPQLMMASKQLLMDLGHVEGTSMPGSGPVDSSQTGNVLVHSVQQFGSAPLAQDIAGPEV